MLPLSISLPHNTSICSGQRLLAPSCATRSFVLPILLCCPQVLAAPLELSQRLVLVTFDGEPASCPRSWHADRGLWLGRVQAVAIHHDIQRFRRRGLRDHDLLPRRPGLRASRLEQGSEFGEHEESDGTTQVPKTALVNAAVRAAAATAAAPCSETTKRGLKLAEHGGLVKFLNANPRYKHGESTRSSKLEVIAMSTPAVIFCLCSMFAPRASLAAPRSCK